MNEQKPRTREEWQDLRKRVIYSEIKYVEPFPDKDDITAPFIVVAIVLIGFLLIVVPSCWAVFFVIFSPLGRACLFLATILLVLLGFWFQKKERLALIKERGEIRRCKFLDGNLPANKKLLNGFCRLYDQNLKKYPYCIYCRNYERIE